MSSKLSCALSAKLVLASTMLALFFSAGCTRTSDNRQHTEGKIGSVNISIPSSDVFIIHYNDGREANRSGRTCSAEIGGMVIFRGWPDLNPITADLQGEFRRTYWSGLGESQWLDIGLRSRNPGGAEGHIALWRLRGLLFDEVVPEEHRRVRVLYDKNEIVGGLSSALTIGPKITRATREGKASPDESRIYWATAQSSPWKLTTLISCTEGAWLAAEGSVSRCEHKFFMEQLQVFGNVRYRANLLPEWKAIEQAVEHHLASYRRECN